MANEALDRAFETLKTFYWGADRKALNPIDDAMVAVHGNEAASKELEGRLAAMLANSASHSATGAVAPSRCATDFICRSLRVIGSAASVPALAALLPENDNSHMARYALERIPAPEAAAALRDALPKVSGALKIGVIGSLGSRRDAASVPALVPLLADPDKAIAASAARALGDIGTKEAADALEGAIKNPPAGVELAFADSSLACAEQLLADGKKAEAIALYKAISAANMPKQVGLAAKGGLLAAMKK